MLFQASHPVAHLQKDEGFWRSPKDYFERIENPINLEQVEA